MKIESRSLFGNTIRGLVLIPETEEESKLIDEYLGQPDTKVWGEIKLADGYGEHYLWLEAIDEAELVSRAKTIVDKERLLAFASQFMGTAYENRS